MSQLGEQPVFQCLCPRGSTGKAYTCHVEFYSFINFQILKHRYAAFSKIRNKEVFGAVIISLYFLSFDAYKI